MKLYLYLIFIILVSSCSSIKTTSVSKIDPTINSEGFYYYLPKAALIATFEIEKSVYEEGVYEKYAGEFGIKIDTTSPPPPLRHTIKQITISTKAVPDDSKIYLADVSKNFLNKSEFSFEYATDGQLTSGDISKESQILPLVTTIVNTATLVTGAVKPLTEAITENHKDAKETYEKIVDINSYIDNLYRNISTNSKAFKTQLETLQNERKSLLSKFTGTTTKKIFNISFEIDPKILINNTPNSLNLFEINNSGIGIINKKITPSQVIEDTYKQDSLSKTISISLDTNSISYYGIKQKKSDDKKLLEGSFFYRIPANAKFSINQKKDAKSTKIKNFELIIPQFGLTVAAPKNLNKINFSLHPDTGALKTVSGTSNTLDIEAYEALRDAGIDFKNSIKPADERDKLIESLEKDLRIKELQESLGIIPSTDDGQ